MSKYNAENLLHDIKALLVANLNTAIDAVESEKVSQGLPATGLPHVDTSAGYIEQSLSDTTINMSPTVFYGISEIKATGAGPFTLEEFKIFCVVLYANSQIDKLVLTRIHRYTRALRDVFETNFDRLPSASKTKIETVVPFPLKLDFNSSEEFFSGGVVLTTGLA